jgi:hypothetical protein
MVEDAAPMLGGTGGELLVGGRTSPGVVRIWNTVHRPVRRSTTTVHAVLRHLEQAGFTGAPRVLGFDDAGREVLTYLEGETAGEAPWPAWMSSDEALVQVGSWLRRLHDTTVGFVPPEDAVWFAGRPWRPGLVIGHHDAAPYNAVWQRGRLDPQPTSDLDGRNHLRAKARERVGSRHPARGSSLAAPAIATASETAPSR